MVYDAVRFFAFFCREWVRFGRNNILSNVTQVRRRRCSDETPSMLKSNIIRSKKECEMHLVEKNVKEFSLPQPIFI